MTKYEERRGLLLSAESQAALTLFQATIAARRAEKMVRDGAHPALAAQRAYDYSNAFVWWLLFVLPTLPVTLWMTAALAQRRNQLALLTGFECLLSFILSLRFADLRRAPADLRPRYRVGSPVIIALYVVSTLGLAVMFLYLLFNQPLGVPSEAW